VGYDIDVFTAIAEEMGYSIEFQDMDFSALIPAVQSGRIDIAVGVTATEERQKNLDFSEIYFKSAISLIVKNGSSIQSEEDLADKTIGAQLGTTLEKYANAQAKGHPGLKVVALGKFPTLIQELKVDRVDGVVSEAVQAIEFTKSNPTLKRVHLGTSEEGYAVAFAKGSSFRLPVNAALLQLEKKGVLKSIYFKWIKE
jgi:polar amino acid transport system substrate-binding protein